GRDGRLAEVTQRLAVVLHAGVAEQAHDERAVPGLPRTSAEPEGDDVRGVRRREGELDSGRVKARLRGDGDVADLVAGGRGKAEERNHIAVLIGQAEGGQRMRRAESSQCRVDQTLRGVEESLDVYRDVAGRAGE